jgi:hypothetical protein
MLPLLACWFRPFQASNVVTSGSFVDWIGTVFSQKKITSVKNATVQVAALVSLSDWTVAVGAVLEDAVLGGMIPRDC